MNCKKFLAAASAAPMIVIAVFMLAPSAWAQGKYKVLYRFSGKDGQYPVAGVVFDAAGNLYGTTQGGGSFGFGTVFKLTSGSNGRWTETVLHSFNDTDDDRGRNGTTFDAAGNLYGTSAGGLADPVGLAYQLAPGTNGQWTETLLYYFGSKGNQDAQNPDASLIFDAAGDLYGTTKAGGKGKGCDGYGCGTVFQLTPGENGQWTETVLHSFSKYEGANPVAALIFDAAGNLYGTTSAGHNTECGTVFKLTPGANGQWTDTVLHGFNTRNGCSPRAGLVFDAAGNLYGTTEYGGGAYSCGVVFKLSPSSNGQWTETVLRYFNGTNGCNPLGGLVFDPAGNLYGTTFRGGADGKGNVFKLAPSGNGKWIERVLHTFHNTDGIGPSAGLILDAAGNLYSTAAYGGGQHNCTPSDDCGVVFEITP